MRRLPGLLILLSFAGSIPVLAQDDVVKGLYESAILLLRQGRPDEALKDLETIYKSYPDSAYADEALHRLGEYYLDNKQFQAALDSFNSLISQFGDRNMAPQAYFDIGRIYANLEFPGFDLEKGDANFTRVSTIYSYSDLVDDALLQSGLIKARLQEFSNARTTLQRLVDEYPQSVLAPEAYFHLGLILVYLGEPIQAMELLQRLIDDYDNRDYSLKALRVLSNLYRTNILVKRRQNLYRPDAAFSKKKFDDLTAIAVDQEDRLHVASDDNPGVRRFSVDGQEVEPLPNHREVQDLFIDPTGQVYIVKKKSIYYEGTDRVFQKKTPKGPEPLEKMSGVVRDAERTFFIQVEKEEQLLRFDKDRNYVGEFPRFRINDFRDLEMDPRGNLYVIDGKLDRLIRVNSAGETTGSLDQKGPGYSLKKMTGVAVDLTGTIYVLDEKENQIAIFSSDLQLITVFSPPGLSKPELLAVDSAGTIYVYDKKEEAIRKYF